MSKKRKFSKDLSSYKPLALGVAALGLLLVVNMKLNLTDKITDLFDRNDLYTQYDKKFTLKPRKGDLFAFIEVDLLSSDLSFEMSKIPFLYHWTEFIRKNSSAVPHIVIHIPQDSPESTVEDLKVYLSRFDNELDMLKRDRLKVGIEKRYNFRDKYKIGAGTQVAIFTSDSTCDSMSIGSIGSFYSAEVLAFINHYCDMLTKFADQIMSEPDGITGQD